MINQYHIKLGKWGNNEAFRLPRKLMEQLQFSLEPKYVAKVEIVNGKKRLIIEEEDDIETKIADFDSLVGIAKLSSLTNTKEIRKARLEDRKNKYESLT